MTNNERERIIKALTEALNDSVDNEAFYWPQRETQRNRFDYSKGYTDGLRYARSVVQSKGVWLSESAFWTVRRIEVERDNYLYVRLW